MSGYDLSRYLAREEPALACARLAASAFQEARGAAACHQRACPLSACPC
jgi:hypothetical protein